MPKLVMWTEPVPLAVSNKFVIEHHRHHGKVLNHRWSMLYSACAREARRRGYIRIITYILESESGASLKASNWSREAWVRGRSWSCPSRPRTDKHPVVNKWRWGLEL